MSGRRSGEVCAEAPGVRLFEVRRNKNICGISSIFQAQLKKSIYIIPPNLSRTPCASPHTTLSLLPLVSSHFHQQIALTMSCNIFFLKGAANINLTLLEFHLDYLRKVMHYFSGSCLLDTWSGEGEVN